jgi:hypothetical protein
MFDVLDTFLLEHRLMASSAVDNETVSPMMCRGCGASLVLSPT